MSFLPGQFLRQARRADIRNLFIAQPVLVQVLRGEKEVQTAASRFTVMAGDFVLLPDHKPLTICNIPAPRGAYEARTIPLSRPVIERALARVKPAADAAVEGRYLVRNLHQDAMRIFEMFFTQQRPAAALPDEVIELRLEELAVWLVLSGLYLPPSGPERVSDRLRNLITADPAAEWSADCAAARLAKSAATLRRHLAAEGASFIGILRDVRLTQAFAILQTSDFSIARVAAEVGYASPQQFSARFKERFGLNPNELRVKKG